MAASVTVSIGGNVITGPSTSSVKLLPVWQSELSEGNVRYVQRSRANQLTQWRLEFGYLSAAEKGALLTFFTDVAKGPKNSFTYVHTDGVSYSPVRFVDAELTFERVNAEHWSTSFTLEQ